MSVVEVSASPPEEQAAAVPEEKPDRASGFRRLLTLLSLRRAEQDSPEDDQDLAPDWTPPRPSYATLDIIALEKPRPKSLGPTAAEMRSFEAAQAAFDAGLPPLPREK